MFRAAFEGEEALEDPRIEDAGKRVPPVIDQQQMEKVLGYIEKGRKHGEPLIGGHRIGETVCFIITSRFTSIHDSGLTHPNLRAVSSLKPSSTTSPSTLKLSVKKSSDPSCASTPSLPKNRRLQWRMIRTMDCMPASLRRIFREPCELRNDSTRGFWGLILLARIFARGRYLLGGRRVDRGRAMG